MKITLRANTLRGQRKVVGITSMGCLTIFLGFVSVTSSFIAVILAIAGKGNAAAILALITGVCFGLIKIFSNILRHEVAKIAADTSGDFVTVYKEKENA